jgi:hypothetical protein
MKKIKIETQKSKIHLAQHMFSSVLTFVFKNHYFIKYRGSRRIQGGGAPPAHAPLNLEKI